MNQPHLGCRCADSFRLRTLCLHALCLDPRFPRCVPQVGADLPNGFYPLPTYALVFPAAIHSDLSRLKVGINLALVNIMRARNRPNTSARRCFIPMRIQGAHLFSLMFHLYGRESREWKSDYYGGTVALYGFRGSWRNELASPVNMPGPTGLPSASAR
jgi:hypothetical protein